MSQRSRPLTNPTLLALEIVNVLNYQPLDEQTSLNNSTHAQFYQSANNQQHPPKFSIGDEVVWAYVSAYDYGVVIDRVWTTETVHKVMGWHYLVRLHPNSSSYPFCKEDWAYEQDLELLSSFTQAVR